MSAEPIILVYDGDCPVCRNYTQYLSIRQVAGSFELLNAHDDSPIIEETNAAQLDLDEGFVLKIGDRFYHGSDAIHTLALLSTRTGMFNRVNFLIFRSKFLSRLMYPILKSGRALLLAILGNRENGYNKRFYGTQRREVLNVEWFLTAQQAQIVINTWLRQVQSHQAKSCPEHVRARPRNDICENPNQWPKRRGQARNCVKKVLDHPKLVNAMISVELVSIGL